MAPNGIIMESILHKILKFGADYIAESIVLSSLLGIVIRAIYRFHTNQAVYDDIMRSKKIQMLITRLSADRALLGASRILVTRIHNGVKWLNKEHMNKLSIYKTLTIEDYTTHTKHRSIDSELNDVKISQLSEILIQVNDKPFDIISVAELPSTMEFKRTLRQDKVKYITLFKIEFQKRILGYIWILFSVDANRDQGIYEDVIKITSEIAEEFK